MSAIGVNVDELTVAVKAKLVQHAEHFKEENLRNAAIAVEYKYQPQKKYSDDLATAQVFSYPPESYVVDMLSQKKILTSHQSVNPHCRYRDCPSYIDPAYYDRIELRKKENPLRQDYKMELMPRLSYSDETLDGDTLYLEEEENSVNNRIRVSLGDRYLFAIKMDHRQEGSLTQEFIDRNPQILREKIVAMGEYTVEYRDTLRAGQWQSANLGEYPALENISSLTEGFLNENRGPIVVYLFSQPRRLPFRTYNVNRILPGIFVGEGPYRTSFSNTFDEMSTMLVDFGIKTVIAIGPPREADRSKFYDYTNGQGKEGQPFKVQMEQGGEFSCYHLSDWYDKSACKNLLQLESALDIMRRASEQDPIFIHCSAGLGRSGVLATILYLPCYLKQNLSAEIITKLENDVELTADEKERLATVIAQGLIHLRQIRPGLIQTEQQLGQAIDMGLCELKREAKLRAKADPLFLDMRFLAPPTEPSSSSSSDMKAGVDVVSSTISVPGHFS